MMRTASVLFTWCPAGVCCCLQTFVLQDRAPGHSKQTEGYAFQCGSFLTELAETCETAVTQIAHHRIILAQLRRKQDCRVAASPLNEQWNSSRYTAMRSKPSCQPATQVVNQFSADPAQQLPSVSCQPPTLCAPPGRCAIPSADIPSSNFFSHLNVPPCHQTLAGQLLGSLSPLLSYPAP